MIILGGSFFFFFFFESVLSFFLAEIGFIHKGNSIQDNIYLSKYYEREYTCRISMWLISILFVLCLVGVLTSLCSKYVDVCIVCITVVYLLSLTSCLCLLVIYDNYIIHIVVVFCFYFIFFLRFCSIEKNMYLPRGKIYSQSGI